MWTKDVCGNDFLKKMRSGEVGVSLVDSEDIYDLNFVYFKNDGKFSQGGFSFELTDVITKDLPWTFKNGNSLLTFQNPRNTVKERRVPALHAKQCLKISLKSIKCHLISQTLSKDIVVRVNQAHVMVLIC